MSHSFYNLWQHLVFSTLNRRPMITDKAAMHLFPYMAQQLAETGSNVKIINGMPDHVHCLFQQNPNKSVAETIKHLKGISSHWINRNNIIPVKFAWQKGYAVFSVSESQVDKVYQYILDQKKRHVGKTFERELNEILKYNKISSDI